MITHNLLSQITFYPWFCGYTFNSLRPSDAYMHICVGNLTIIGLSPGRRQAITWTNVGILLIGPLGTNFSEMLIEIHTFLFKKIHLKMSSGKWRPFCLGLNVLINADCNFTACTTVASPILLSEWSYYSLTLNHRFNMTPKSINSLKNYSLNNAFYLQLDISHWSSLKEKWDGRSLS